MGGIATTIYLTLVLLLSAIVLALKFRLFRVQGVFLSLRSAGIDSVVIEKCGTLS